MYENLAIPGKCLSHCFYYNVKFFNPFPTGEILRSHNFAAMLWWRSNNENCNIFKIFQLILINIELQRITHYLYSELLSE